MQGYRIVLPAGLPLLSSNMRLHHMERYRRGKGIKDAAWAVAKSQRLPPLLRADVDVIVHPGPRTRLFDAHNFMDSAKPAIDGLVLAGVLPKDDNRYLRSVLIRAGERRDGWQLELVVMPYEMPSTSMPVTLPSVS